MQLEQAESSCTVPGSSGGDGGESNSPSKRCLAKIYYKLIRLVCFSSPEFIAGKSFVRLANILSVRCIGERRIGTSLVGALVRSARRVLAGRAALGG